MLDFILPFLAMAKSKQASLCSSGLTKTFLCYSVEKVLLSKIKSAFWEIYGKSTGNLRDMFEQHLPLLKPFTHRCFVNFTGNVR